MSFLRPRKEIRKVGGIRYKRVAAGARLPTPWLIEPAKRPDDRADSACLWVVQETVQLVSAIVRMVGTGNQSVWTDT